MSDERYSKLLTKYYLVIAGIILAVVYWFIESFIHYVSSAYEHNFFTHLLQMDMNELVMRLTFTSVLLVMSIIIQRLVNGIRKSEKNTERAFQELDLYKNLLIHDFRNIIQNIQ